MMLRWIKMIGGHAVAFSLLWGGGLIAVFAITILRDLLFVTSEVPLNGMAIVFAVAAAALVGLGPAGRLLYYLWGTVWPVETALDPSLNQLRPGYTVDYEMRTWEVTAHRKYPYEGWPAETWRLENENETLLLEYEREDGDTFRLSEQVAPEEVTIEGKSFPEASTANAPDAISYQGTEYALAERDARVQDETQVREGDEYHINILVRSRSSRLLRGACGGLAEYLNLYPWEIRLAYLLVSAGIVVLLGVFLSLFGLGLADVLILPGFGQLLILPMLIGGYYAFASLIPEPPPERLTKHWVYETDDGAFVALECVRLGRWTGRAGREVEPYEFDNILPPE